MTYGEFSEAQARRSRQFAEAQTSAMSVYCDAERDLKELQAENAKLRTFLGGDSIVTDYWKDEDGTMHVLTTDGEHTYEYMRGGLADENAKLRELVRDMHKALFSLNLDHCQACPREDACVFMHKSFDCEECAFERDMRELGIEVD